MRKTYFIAIYLLLTAIISSCVSSLYPISDNEKDFVFRQELLGRWKDTENKTQAIVRRDDDKKYSIAIIDKEIGKGTNKKGPDTSYLSGFLIQLGGQLFLDCMPDTEHPQFDCLGEEVKSTLLPLHMIYKIDIIGKNQLSIAGMNIDSLQKFLSANKKIAKYEKPNKDHIMLTDDAGGLQKKILLNKQAAFVFSEKMIFNRQK
jgi:hypothetical protein